jgi:hypothetical protein
VWFHHGTCIHDGEDASGGRITLTADKRSRMAGCWWVMPIIPATQEAEIWRITVQGQLWQMILETPISKIIRAKWTGGVAQLVECLLSKCKALNSNPSPTEGGERERERRMGFGRISMGDRGGT